MMSDPSCDAGLSRNPPMRSSIPGRKLRSKSLVASTASSFSRNAYGHITSLRHGGLGSGLIVHGVSFLGKVAALETLRRFSNAKCPLIWRCLQALQLLCYPPFKWLQKWAFFRNLVKSMQTLSRPLLVLSIATAFTEPQEANTNGLNHIDDSQLQADHPPESAASQPTFDSSCMICNEAPQVVNSENWISRLKKELENQGIRLPDRINEDELGKFYAAANGDFSCLLSSIKKTIRWRETYGILNSEELESWSQMVFWHGYDVNHRPCLIVRLGLACLSLPSCARPRFAQAVISQVEHGVLHLREEESSQITVLVDCEGLTPFRIPMQTIRSCFFLLQNHYPNRLGCLFVIRLPPVVRVIAQTLIQVLKPKTREKLRIEGEMFEKVLFEYLQTLPSYLGGKCSCLRCRNMESSDDRISQLSKASSTEPMLALEAEGEEEPVSTHLRYETDVDLNVDCNQVLRTAMIAILMLWLLAALIAGIYDPESRPAFPPLRQG